jgi:hypothetical protein
VPEVSIDNLTPLDLRSCYLVAGCYKKCLSNHSKELKMQKLAIPLLLAGLFAGPALALDDVVSVELKALNNSGETGSATLLPEGKQTKVVIELSNTPGGVAQPAHIHLGTCDKLDKAPKWPLEPVKDGRSVTMVPVPLDTILREKSAINIHKSAAEASVYVACGNIIAPM